MSTTPAEKRVKRFQAKLDPDVIASVIESKKEDMVAKQTVRQAELADLQSFVKLLLAEKGVHAEFTVPFIKVAHRLYAITKKHEKGIAEVEAKHYLNYTYCKYKNVFSTALGVDEILQRIASYLGITWTAPTACYS